MTITLVHVSTVQTCGLTHEHDAAGCLDCGCRLAPWSFGYTEHWTTEATTD